MKTGTPIGGLQFFLNWIALMLWTSTLSLLLLMLDFHVLWFTDLTNDERAFMGLLFLVFLVPIGFGSLAPSFLLAGRSLVIKAVLPVAVAASNWISLSVSMNNDIEFWAGVVLMVGNGIVVTGIGLWIEHRIPRRSRNVAPTPL